MNAQQLQPGDLAAWAEAQQRGGATWDWLSVVDHGLVNSSLPRWEVFFALRGGPGSSQLYSWLPGEGGAWPSLRTVWAGAGWHEDEAAALFGIQWDVATAVPRCESFAVSGPGVASRSLRKDVVLVPRTDRPWPGASGEGTGAKRQRFLPPGIPSADAVIAPDGQLNRGEH